MFYFIDETVKNLGFLIFVGFSPILNLNYLLRFNFENGCGKAFILSGTKYLL